MLLSTTPPLRRDREKTFSISSNKADLPPGFLSSSSNLTRTSQETAVLVAVPRASLDDTLFLPELSGTPLLLATN